MKAWIYRWDDGTSAIVIAESKAAAWEILDENAPVNEDDMEEFHCDSRPGFSITMRPTLKRCDEGIAPFLNAVLSVEAEDIAIQLCYPKIHDAIGLSDEEQRKAFKEEMKKP